MEEGIERTKKEIAILAENILYNRIRARNERGGLSEQIKNEMIDAFVQEYSKRFKQLSYEEIKEQVIFALNRTNNNIKRIKEEKGR